MNEEIKNEIETKIWMIQETAKELNEILKKHGEKVIGFEQLFSLKSVVIETEIKYNKIAKKFEEEKLNILKLKKEPK